MSRMKREPNTEFGLFDYTMVPKLRRLLKPHGLYLKVRTSYSEWGDGVEVSIVPLPKAVKGSSKSRRRKTASRRALTVTATPNVMKMMYQPKVEIS